MIKTSLKSFFKNLIYIFVPMGVIYLFVILAAGSFVSSLVKELAGLAQAISQITDSVFQPEFDMINEFFQSDFIKTDWNKDVLTIIKQIANTDWIADMLRSFVKFIEENYSASYAEEISELTEKSISNFKEYQSAAVSVCVSGIFTGYFLCRLLIRRKLARRSFGKMIIAYVCEALLTSAMLVFAGWISFAWNYGVFLAAFILIFIFSALSLIIAWLIQNRKTVRFKRVVNLKNAVQLMIANLIILVLVGLLTALLTLIFNGFIGLLFSIPLFIYGVIIVSVNAEAYVAELARMIKSQPYKRVERFVGLKNNSYTQKSVAVSEEKKINNI